mmetsp:Transcript_11710/g.15903  ORF Transcript_11710/g.15903 Transcript_11710/m.15903 type:complete len:149 (-) Transcript_11710:93-539(-)|eukprot:CAMPEP_0185583062 /NCGR_PEP_ID=MMETSP0434-20130131/21297_1 /TAXON_ID=626734 ORGANISM="Favella taraikaensis, Strain Fe Narragansett Bay" /NCGR_SAMPLE_ID=MMETSP0434 /ASSEMBLY_ACC=CAM_ASM_000379 /LENGTH=148 /DNA_ID=CAMNT_0028202053 /DNA_START=23 /DNA_END=469 /DNA_ORIENTATION=+
MVVKTELCAFSEYRIYPGHGMKFVRRDGQPVIISSAKCRCMINQRKKPSKLVWTQAWRRLNKKGKDEGAGRKKSRRTVKAQRAIVGASIEDIKKRRQTPKARSVATEAALKEVKDRKKAGGAKHYSTGPKNTGGVAKNQKSSASSKAK